jgi:hypothetical protein
MEDEGDTFLRNVSNDLQDYTVTNPKKHIPYFRRRENLKPHLSSHPSHYSKK